MTDQDKSDHGSSFVEEFKRAPAWQRGFIALLLVAGGVALIEKVGLSLLGSSEARSIKAQIEPIAEQLEKAEKVGDKQTAIALLDPVSKMVRDYNDLGEARKAEINKSALRYCVLAAINLLDGVIGVADTGYWVSKSKYQAAISECK